MKGEKYLNHVLQMFTWYKKHLQNVIVLLVVPMQIQAINQLIFMAQSSDVFLRNLHIFY
jgi:hypothetical protein